MFAALATLFLARQVSAAYPSYSVADSFTGSQFLDWNFYANADPTHGRVEYVDKATAQSENLAVVTDSTFIMRADAVNVVQPSDPGRKSVRISSPQAYSDSVLVLDLSHMPVGCGTWPAFWTVSQHGTWPRGGEIDIIEGVNTNKQNLASLHTTPNCTMPQDRTQSGSSVSSDCNAFVNYNQGCGVAFNKPDSYGSSFNDRGGGFYAMQRSQDGVNVWFWTRNDSNLPMEIDKNLPTINPQYWGTPEAFFPTTQCSYDGHFNAHNVVFDLTFCGDWAGSAYSKSGCGGDCIDFVNNNPAAFKEAYWELRSLTAYLPDSGSTL
ncbi:GH16 domain-containing protein [Mycena kentingensis (nom. inval.)]|nr:GH16 domain-containing protein [Mycena kentingensis (nom. inval.)]